MKMMSTVEKWLLDNGWQCTYDKGGDMVEYERAEVTVRLYYGGELKIEVYAGDLLVQASQHDCWYNGKTGELQMHTCEASLACAEEK